MLHAPKHFNPEQVPNVPAVVKAYFGSQGMLNAGLQRKYGHNLLTWSPPGEDRSFSERFSDGRNEHHDAPLLLGSATGFGDGNDDDGENKMDGAIEKTLYEGSFGSMHVDRGAWMPNAGDSESIREAIKNVCSPPRHSSFSLDDDDEGAENVN